MPTTDQVTSLPVAVDSTRWVQACAWHTYIVYMCGTIGDHGIFPCTFYRTHYFIYLTKSLFYTFSYKSIIIGIFFFLRCSCILTRMRKYAAALFLVVVVVDSWYVIEEEDLCLLCMDFPVD